mmetsp:Transcript_46579/g.107955  ORF Transcript_46579/g.107955 Transcript_46579/m.107955 type:complete len:233 (-) Transcript_46579:77-775(-)
MALDEAYHLRELARDQHEEDGEGTLPDVHVEHVVVPRDLEALLLRFALDLVLVGAIDAVAEQRTEHHAQTDHHLRVQLHLLSLHPLAEGEDHQAKTEHGDADDLRRRDLHLVEDRLPEHHRDGLARLHQHLQREDDVAKRHVVEHVRAQVCEGCEHPLSVRRSAGEGGLLPPLQHHKGDEGIREGRHHDDGELEAESLLLLAELCGRQRLHCPAIHREADPDAHREEDQGGH